MRSRLDDSSNRNLTAQSYPTNNDDSRQVRDVMAAVRIEIRENRQRVFRERCERMCPIAVEDATRFSGHCSRWRQEWAARRHDTFVSENPT